MNNKHRLSLFAYTLILAYPALGTSQFTPFPPTPLNLQPKPADRVPPNILVMLDNSYDGSFTADAKNDNPASNVINPRQTKIQVAKEVINELAEDNPNYRWGVAGYSPYTADVDKYINKIPLCYEYGTWRNMQSTGCTFASTFGVLEKSKNIVEIPYPHEVGGQLYAPIKTRDSSALSDFKSAVTNMPEWGKGSGAHASPLTSAYYEMTRYFRGMKSAYQREGGDSKNETTNIPDGAFNPADKGQYISPIQYRCQSNNIIIINSATDIRLSSQAKAKRGFYEAYHTDPLFKHDNPKYAYVLDKPTDTSYAGKKNSADYSRLIISDFVNWVPLTVPPNANTPLYNQERAAIEYYNNLFNPSEKGAQFVWNRLYIGKHYIRQLNNGVDEKGRKIRDMRDIKADYLEQGGDYNEKHPGKGESYTLSDNSVINPYMDIIETVRPDKISAEQIKMYQENQNPDAIFGVKNVITRNAYNENSGLDAFAHLAHDGDIVALGKEYIYPTINFVDSGNASIVRNSSSDYSTYADKKSLFYQNGSNITVSDKDAEGKAWDGTDDGVQKDKDGNLVDYSRKFSKQNINTYTVGFGLYSPSIEDFRKFTIQKFGVCSVEPCAWYSDLDQTLFIDYQDGKDPIVNIGDFIFYDGKMLINHEGEPTQTTTTVLSEGSGRYVWANRFPSSVCILNGSRVAYGLNNDGKNKLLGDKQCTDLHGADDTVGKVIQLKEGQRGIVTGTQIKIIPGDIAEQHINPQPKADYLLKQAAQKGGGVYLTANTSNPVNGKAELRSALNTILAQIEASLISLPVGSALGSNDTKISTAITPTLNTDRWLSQLRFYNLQPDGIFKKDDFKLPDYTKSSTTLISTPDGVRELSEDGTQNNITFNNEAFNIGNSADLPAGSKVDHNGKSNLQLALSSEQNEWQSLVKWLLQSTDNDRDDAFKSNIFGVDKLVYRDRAPNNKGSRGHLLGDILDSNIVPFGGEKNPITGNSGKEIYKTGDNHPYLAVGANDGMLHIFESNKKDAQAEHPYFHKFAYIPGTAKRADKNDTIMRNLVYTAEQSYGMQGNPHQYFVNGEIFYRKTDSGLVGQSDQGQMMLVGSLGQGGRAAYSLNIGGERYGSGVKIGLEATTGDTVDNVPLWDTSTDQFGKAKVGVDENMGYPIGSPQVGRVSLKNIKGATQFSNDADVRYATFLNSGVDSGKKPTLFVLDQLGVNAAPLFEQNKRKPISPNQQSAGELIKAIEAGDKAGGLAAPLFVDYNRDGISDFVYAGDSNGNMWRFELRGGKDSWKAIQIYQGSPRAKQGSASFAGDGAITDFPLPDTVKTDTVTANKVTVKNIAKTLTTDFIIENHATEDKKIIKFVTAPAAGEEIKIDYTVAKQAQPITTAPDIYYDGKSSKIHVFFGTGSVLYQKDFTDKNKQAMFGIVDDFSCSSNCAVSKEKLTKRVLNEATGNVKVGSQTLSNTSYRTLEVLPKNTKMSEKGWYVPLNVDPNAENGSERVVIRPLVIADQYQNSGTVFFTTRIFQDIHATVGKVSCTPPPVKVKSWVMGLDVHTGGNPKKVQLGNLVNSKASVAGYSVNGQASAFLRTDSGAEINQHGAGTQGVAAPLLNPNQSVVRVVRTCKVDGTANTAISVQNPDGSSTITRFELDCGKPLSRRLSWREIF